MNWCFYRILNTLVHKSPRTELNFKKNDDFRKNPIFELYHNSLN